MAKFNKKRGKSKPAISTASLPDIIFMLLFFFMVVTVLRDSTLLVKVQTPDATELTKLDDKTVVNYIFIGRPTTQNQAIYGTSPRIQLNDKIVEPDRLGLEVANFLIDHKNTVDEKKRPLITTSLKVDGDVTLGIVQDVKVELRKNNQLRVNYSAGRRMEDL
ncbi:MAG: biopolymer transporter ExbD [Bacteroidota bacterium]